MVSRILSTEDGDLSTPSLITARKSNYLDIDLTFNARPSGDVYKKKDAAAVKQAVKNLLLTNPGEKPFNFNFGGGLNRLIFELIDEDAEEELDAAIRLAIENYEPRAKVLETYTNITPDQNSITVSITFQVVNTNETVILETSLARVR
jgi:phage baseplate assembly protein W